MPRKRVIRPDEATIWLGILLDAAFDPTSHVLNLARSAELLNEQARKHNLPGHHTARDGKSQLIDLAGDFTRYPEDYSDQRQAELLLIWANRWIQPEDWQRLQARLKMRRQKTRARDTPAL